MLQEWPLLPRAQNQASLFPEAAPSPPVPRVKVTAPTVHAMHRERLLDRLAHHSRWRVASVVAPAGSGKTTLLSQFAARSTGPVAWYRAEPDDASAVGMLRGLAAADAGPTGTAIVPGSVDELVAVIDRWPGEFGLVVDDLHTVLGSEGEMVVRRLIEHAPPSLRLVLASRRAPSFLNLSRLRLSNDLLEIGPDELRFRSWEVERLFDEFYGERLPPEELAELARRTEGWAAGLQLFHLATRGKPLPERRRVLRELGAQTGMVREYLAQNVLDELPDDVRRFMVATCVLERLTGPLCDELLGTEGSDQILRGLASGQIFTVSLEGGSFRYHEVLRSHLAGALVAEVGEVEAKRRHQQAGELLQRSGAVSDALWAYCRAGDWHAAAHLLGRNGGPVGPCRGRWIDVLPAGLLEQDAWLTLAKARRCLEVGEWQAAVDAYRAAERHFPAGSGQEICRRERSGLAMWLETAPNLRSDWISLLRAATQGDPLRIAARARSLPGATGRLVEAVALLVAGHVEDGSRVLESILATPDLGPLVAIVTGVLSAGAAYAASGHCSEDWDTLIDQADAAGLSGLAGILRTTAALIRGTEPSGQRAITACEGRGDRWGAALLTLAEGFIRLQQGMPAARIFARAAVRFRELDAGALEHWAGAGLALAQTREQGSQSAPVAPAKPVLGHGIPGAKVLTLVALAGQNEGQKDRYADLARAEAGECGFRWPLALLTSSTAMTAPAAPSAPDSGRLRCFGRFGLSMGETVVDVAAVKPRVRAVLQILALQAGQPVHRERIINALWPEVGAQAGIRNLQVAISTLRQLLQHAPGPVQIAREGDSYRLVLPPGVDFDVTRFGAAVSAARSARKRGEDETVIAAAEEALCLYTGDLLPEAGPADWIVDVRDRLRRDAADAAQQLAEVHLGRNEYEPAVEACEHGLALDSYRDGLWRILAAGYDGLGESASAARARAAYADVLDDLGVAT